MRVQSAGGEAKNSLREGHAPGGKWLALLRGDQVGGERVLGGISGEVCAGGRRGAEQGAPRLQAAQVEPGGPDPGPGNARAGLKGRRHLRPRARVPGPELFIQEGPRGGAWARHSGCRASGGAGVPDSRINVLKATTPSSPCRKMPKLCMSAPLSQRPAPDAAVEDPPGSPRLAFPAGPCMTEPAEERGRRGPHSHAACGGRAASRSPSPEPGVQAGPSAPPPTQHRA